MPSSARLAPYTRHIATRPLNTARANKRRAELLEIGFELFADYDYDELSIDDVAEKAGVSHGLVYQYFGSKKGFYVAGLQWVLDEFNRRIEPDMSLPPEERLRAGLRAYVEWAAEHPRGYRSLMVGAVGFKEVQELVEEARWQGIARIAQGLGLDVEAPVVRVGLRGWAGYVDGAILTWLQYGEPDKEELIDMLVRALLTTIESFAAA